MTTSDPEPEEGVREILIWAIGIDHTHPFEEELMDAAFEIAEKYDIDIGGIGGYAHPAES